MTDRGANTPRQGEKGRWRRGGKRVGQEVRDDALPAPIEERWGGFRQDI